MKLIEKNTFGDDTFYILEMDAQVRRPLLRILVALMVVISCIMVYLPLMTLL